MTSATTGNFTKTLMSGVATTALMLGLAASAQAQNSQLDPTFGTVSEAEGFGSVSQTIQAGGDIDANTLAASCNGFIADAPDIIFDYSGQASVFIEAFSNADTTMVVEAPDGQIICNDDFNELNPGMQTSFAEPGRYAVWIGTYEPIANNTYPDADVNFTEASDQPTDDVARPVMPSEDVFATGFNALEAPAFGEIAVTSGFGQQTFTLQAGGGVDAFATNNACAGYIADVPDYTINYSAGAGTPLDIAVDSASDTTLVVVGPNGTVYCNDDDLDLNPALSIAAPIGGAYAVWVGTFSPIEGDVYPEAVMTVATSGLVRGNPDGGNGGGGTDPIPGGGFDISGTPTFGTVSLSDLTAGHEITLQAGGGVDAAAVNTFCNGFIADVPDYVIDYTGGNDALTVSSTSQVDTTLVVVGPDGQTYCNDDAVDLNPAVTIANAGPGAYSVFVGTFAPIENDFYPDTLLRVSNDVQANIPASPVGRGDIVQRAALAPAFGTGNLAEGFGLSTVELQAGGDLDAADVDFSCIGFIAEAPDYIVNYSGSTGLSMIARSEADTTLTVLDPAGTVHCNDDYEGFSAGLLLNGDTPGTYAVWVGTYEAIQDGVFPATSLVIEEFSGIKTQPSGAISSLSLTAGFTPDPFTTPVAAGGAVEAFSLSDMCNGFVATEPDFVLNYTAGDWPLGISATADADTTLAVRLPNGEFMCSDDVDGFNPAIAIAQPASGRYEVHVGTFSRGDINAVATLAVTEVLDQKELPPGALTQATIVSGTQRQEFDLLAGGSFEAASNFGDACYGFVATNPDFIATVNEPGVSVEMTVRAAEDTTLVVRGPNGRIMCDDDSAGDLNPLILMENAATGPYEIWLGTYSGASNAPATFSMRDVNADSSVAPNVPDGGKK